MAWGVDDLDDVVFPEAEVVTAIMVTPRSALNHPVMVAAPSVDLTNLVGLTGVVKSAPGGGLTSIDVGPCRCCGGP